VPFLALSERRIINESVSEIVARMNEPNSEMKKSGRRKQDSQKRLSVSDLGCIHYRSNPAVVGQLKQYHAEGTYDIEAGLMTPLTILLCKPKHPEKGQGDLL
jgi:hypothetical protein